ncbi:mspA family protein, partial [Nocardia sp. NPDC059246]
MNPRTLRSAVAAAVCIGAIAVPGVTTAGPAHADTFVALPDGTKQGPNGVVITRSGEHATISPSLADNGAGRTVWVSGNASAD